MNYCYVVFSYQTLTKDITRESFTVSSNSDEFMPGSFLRQMQEVLKDKMNPGTFIIENWIPISAAQYNDWNRPDSTPTQGEGSEAV